MVTIATKEFNAAVDEFKKTFSAHTQLYRYGQFYLLNRVLDAILGSAQVEIDGNIRFKLNPAEGAQIMGGLRGSLAHIPLPLLNLRALDRILAVFDQSGDMGPIREMFKDDRPGPSDIRAVRNAYNVVWSRSDIGPAPPLLTLPANMKTARAAFAFEKDKCFTTARSFANKLLNARKVTSLAKGLKISAGNVAGARLVGKPPGLGPVVEQQTITYTVPAQLDSAAAAMRKAIDAGAVVQCGVVSGARLDKNMAEQPEHYVVAFAYGKVDSMHAFLFWDPDAVVSDIKSTTWGQGFGVLFSRPRRLCTAIDDGDLANIERNRNSATFGDHLTEKRRHCYQVFWLQTLPLWEVPCRILVAAVFFTSLDLVSPPADSQAIVIRRFGCRRAMTESKLDGQDNADKPLKLK